MFGRRIWNAYVGGGVTRWMGGGWLFASTLLLTAALARADFITDFSSFVSPSELAAGKAINIFTRYGYFITSMHVVPHDDAKTWVFREPTFSVFRDVQFFSAGPKQHTEQLSVEDFHIEFCDNMTQLLQAYFRDFSIERVKEPWRAFATGWDARSTAEEMGIAPWYAHGDHCYVLVRVSRYRESERLRDLPNNITVEEAVSEAIRNTTVSDGKSVADFMKKYGSHYISSYTTGNSLYQVIVFYRGVYNDIKDQLQRHGVTRFPPASMSPFFSRLGTLHIGDIKVASGNKTVESWALNHLTDHYYNFSWPSLIKLHSQPSLLRNLDTLLGNEALLQLELKTLSPAFKDVKKKQLFEEVLDNNLKLWETNLSE